MINFTKEQKEILKYTSGNMCISAVPGAGKTFILTHLAYNLSKILKNDEQILVLTYMNSATFNFYNNLKNIDKNINNIQVKTIHKFCLDLIFICSLEKANFSFDILRESLTFSILFFLRIS